MVTLSVKVRKDLGKKIKTLRKKGILPGVLYGPEIKNLAIEVDQKEFEKVFKEAGETTIIELKIKDEKSKIKEFPVLIKEIAIDPLTEKFLHIDFYQPKLKEKIEAKIPLVFIGESLAVKNLEGTLVKNIHEVGVKALPQNLPKKIEINIESLKTFEDYIKISDLIVPEGVEILKKPDEIVASVLPPKKIEEELKKPAEAKVEEVEKVEKKKEEEEEKK